ncbi:Sec-dependent nitrous-oxide reductase [Myxococcota bacterium]|nr:Sec-dependent nitrous-oxide reductase [Myxococcota bacterium]
MRAASRRAAAIGLAACAASACGQNGGNGRNGGNGVEDAATVQEVMAARGLSEEDLLAAAKTYLPSGKLDEYVMLTSGGQSGHLLVIGVPSMRIIKYVAVFSPEPWQGYGYGGLGDEVLYGQGQRGKKRLAWGDTHHPALSETGGDYDGEFVFLNDKANARIAVIDLRDFVTRQIVANPLIVSNHGATFVTPGTEYVVEGGQYPAPLGGGYAPLSAYEDEYRSAVTFWKFDRAKGRIDEDASFAIELPPYMQDLADAGKLASDGWVFLNSFNTELYPGTRGIEGQPPLESGASQNDMDYLHVIDWRKAERLVQEGRAREIAGIRVLPLEVAARERVLTFVPEPKSPHGVDVTPDGTAIVVSGKLDTHCTIYEMSKIKDLIERGQFAGKDRYGVDVLDFPSTIRGQVQVGLGPLHTVFDDKGNAYTSVFLDSTVNRWSYERLDQPVEAIPVHYNVGHITAVEGDTVSPGGRFVVAMNKLSQDRFVEVGPLYPQNFQLIDISGPKMRLLYDMPLPLGEPHYAQIMRADRLETVQVYSPPGVNSYTGELVPGAPTAGEERIERNGRKVDVYMTVIRSHYTPDTIEVNEGDEVTLHITNIEQATDQTHGFTVDMYNINLSLEPGKYEEVRFIADTPGVFPMYCTEFCSALHLEMAGYFLVKPKGAR